LIAIGDIHGDGYALKQILQNMKVINDKSEWIGGKTMVVLLGDVLDRGISSRKAVDLIMDIQHKQHYQMVACLL